METQFSLYNSIFDLSHRQFLSLTQKFKDVAEKSFGTECALDIRVTSRVPQAPATFGKTMIKFAADTNSDDTLLQTTSLSDVTKGVWKKAAYIEVGVKPIDPAQAHSPTSLGHIAFKGNAPKQASFYIQGEKDMLYGYGRMALEGTPFSNLYRTKAAGYGMKSQI